MGLRFGLVLVASLAIVGCTNMHAEDNEKEGDEVKIKFAEAPAAVQATLRKESNNAAIDTIDKETDEGKTIYEADAMVNGENWEIKVAEDGHLISKKLDPEEGEKKEGKEKDEKEEKEDKK